jgi:hypothetical protein
MESGLQDDHVLTVSDDEMAAKVGLLGTDIRVKVTQGNWRRGEER